MAFDKKPSTWLGPGFALDSTNHLVKLNTNTASSNKLLAELVDADADPTTGDIRIVAFALADALYQAWLAQGVNVPAKMKVSRSARAGLNGTLIHTYNLQFTLSPPTSFAVAGE